MKWIIMPVLAGPEMTEAAISDCLAMEGTNLLVINQGVDDPFRERLEQFAEAETAVHVWHHMPPLPSLGATWNRALDFAWTCGGSEALVVNNDVRLDPRTYSILEAVLTWPKTEHLFVSAVAVTLDQFNARPDPLFDLNPLADAYNAKLPLDKGGPDFSCYMISKACHTQYRFDENFIPAYCEDLDYHRRLMLAGQGDKIFSINLPYLHLAAQTLKQIDPQKRMKIEAAIGANSRAYYQRKWGGPVNQETFYHPFTGAPGVYIVGQDAERHADWARRCGPSTPELQAWSRAADRGVVPPESDIRQPDLVDVTRRMLDLTVSKESS